MSNEKHVVLWDEIESMPKTIPDMGTCKIFTKALGIEKMVMIVGRFAPGERLVSHHHIEPTEEVYYVMRGKGTVYIRGASGGGRHGPICSSGYSPLSGEHR
jgi:quercetin dioxygenase-like cupin family protein